MEPSAEVEGALRRFVHTVAAGDLETILAVQSTEPGRRLIGTDPREWYTDDEIDVSWRVQLGDLLAAGTSLRDLEVEGFEEGTVGWGAATFLQSVGSVRGLRVRVTAVFHLERGHWHVVQMHASTAVTNEDAVGDRAGDDVRRCRRRSPRKEARPGCACSAGRHGHPAVH